MTKILNEIKDLDVDILGLVDDSNSSTFATLIANILTQQGYASSRSSHAEAKAASIFYKSDKLICEPQKVELEKEADN